VSCTTGTVIFDYTYWSAKYPALAASVTEAVAQVWFDEAGTLYLNNSPASRVQDLPTRAIILGQLTAHLILLNVPINGQASSGLVGRISNASEGSVSVAVQNEYPPGSAQWFQQTIPGSSAWQAMSNYRAARYISPQRCYGGYGWPFR
jgi:hypothetical protein